MLSSEIITNGNNISHQKEGKFRTSFLRGKKNTWVNLLKKTRAVIREYGKNSAFAGLQWPAPTHRFQDFNFQSDFGSNTKMK